MAEIFYHWELFFELRCGDRFNATGVRTREARMYVSHDTEQRPTGTRLPVGQSILIIAGLSVLSWAAVVSLGLALSAVL